MKKSILNKYKRTIRKSIKSKHKLKKQKGGNDIIRYWVFNEDNSLVMETIDDLSNEISIFAQSDLKDLNSAEVT